MALELTEDFIKDNSLTSVQVTAIESNSNTYTDNLVADTKKEYDGKANTDAEAILNGAADKITAITGINREQGQKMGDFIGAAWEGFSSAKTGELDKAKLDYETKLKDFKGDDATREALDKSRLEYDDLLKKTADYDTLKETADKFNPLQEQYSGMKLEVAFGGVKPKFPDTVNEYEASAKWKEFTANVLKNNDIEIVDGEAVAVDKENKHKIVKLKDLVAKDESMAALLKGREQGGTGATEAEKVSIEGVPFEVPANADGNTIQKLITEHLTGKGLSFTSTEFSSQFNVLYTKIREQKNA